MHDVLTQISWIAFFGLAAQWLGWRMKTPAIVFLLIGGFLAGPVFDLVHPQALLGDLLQPVVSLAVGIILFEGSLNLNFKEIRQAQASIRRIIMVSGPLVWAMTTLAGYYVAGLSFPVALTFGALLIVTGPTVIIPLLKNAHLKERPASILKWEGIINDPIGAVLAILCYEYFKITAGNSPEISTFFASTLMEIGLIGFFGVLAAYCTSALFNRDLIPEYLKPTFLLSTVVVFFALCNSIEHDFGLIGVTIFGVALANMGVTGIEEIKRFKETLSMMLISGVFIMLTANIDPLILLGIDWRGFAFIALLLFVIRPLAVAAASVGTKMSWPEVFLTGWIAPRGIVCAAVAGVLGPFLVELGYADGAQILALAFAIVLFSVIAHGLSAAPLGKKLGLAYGGEDSLLIVGASEWAVQFAQTLKNRGIDVMIADKNWHALRPARLANIPVYYGEILSDETEYHLELARYNMLLAVTNNPAYNALVCNKFIHEFGRDKVYQFLPHEEDEHERRQMTSDVRGQTFGGADLDFWDISGYFLQGWRFRTSRVGQEDNLKALQEQAKAGTLKILGMFTPRKRLGLSVVNNFEALSPEHVLVLFESETLRVEPKPDTSEETQTEH